jgi:hypothetical protein
MCQLYNNQGNSTELPSFKFYKRLIISVLLNLIKILEGLKKILGNVNGYDSMYPSYKELSNFF